VARKIKWTQRAVADLEAAYRYFSQDNPSYASRFASKILEAADSLAEFPERGRVAHDVELPNIRELIVEKYRLVYEVESEIVNLLRIIHGRQDFKSVWKARRKK
jgi:addiction module RelE/StbE family toxin